MKKNNMTLRVHQISTYLSLTIIHILTIVLLFAFLLYETYAFRYTDALYAIFLVLVLPLVTSNIKKAPTSISVLPILSKKYYFTEKKYQTMRMSFLFESIILLFMQIGNYITPYESLFLQFIPVSLLIGRVFANVILTSIIKLYLQYQLNNNLL